MPLIKWTREKERRIYAQTHIKNTKQGDLYTFDNNNSRSNNILLLSSLLITICINHHAKQFFYQSPILRVTCISITGQRLGKLLPAETNTRNNRMSIARQRISKQTSSTIQRLCFLHGPCRGVIKGQSRSCELNFIRSWESSIEKEFISCRELGRVLEMAVEGDWEEMVRNELGGAKKTSYVIWSDSETAINSLPGCD
jgi:hypothetical protein